MIKYIQKEKKIVPTLDNFVEYMMHCVALPDNELYGTPGQCIVWHSWPNWLDTQVTE